MTLEPCTVEQQIQAGEARWYQQQSRVLVTICDEDCRKRITSDLEAAGWFAAEAAGGAEALDILDTAPWDAVLLDSWLPDLDVKELIGIIRKTHCGVEVFVRDCDTGRLLAPRESPQKPELQTLFRLLDDPSGGVADEVASLPETVADAPCATAYAEVLPLPNMVGSSPAMLRAYRLARMVSPRATAVLIMGESGTGKELVASAIHHLSPRSNRPFVVVNCAAIPETLLETELFGHARGAFSGAVQSRMGRVQASDGGTLFLDEVGELPLSMQPKLLRFLQSGEIQRLGSNEAIHVDVRVIAATNAKLAERVAAREFREDLYYRLAAFPIELEPLRERPHDVLELSSHFLEALCHESGTPRKMFSTKATRFLEQYLWPGNVRELKQTIERAFILSEDGRELALEHFWPSGSGIVLKKF